LSIGTAAAKSSQADYFVFRWRQRNSGLVVENFADAKLNAKQFPVLLDFDGNYVNAVTAP
jgi:hypothetical protein